MLPAPCGSEPRPRLSACLLTCAAACPPALPSRPTPCRGPAARSALRPAAAAGAGPREAPTSVRAFGPGRGAGGCGARGCGPGTRAPRHRRGGRLLPGGHLSGPGAGHLLPQAVCRRRGAGHPALPPAAAPAAAAAVCSVAGQRPRRCGGCGGHPAHAAGLQRRAGGSQAPAPAAADRRPGGRHARQRRGQQRQGGAGRAAGCQARRSRPVVHACPAPA